MFENGINFDMLEPLEFANGIEAFALLTESDFEFSHMPESFFNAAIVAVNGKRLLARERNEKGKILVSAFTLETEYCHFLHKQKNPIFFCLSDFRTKTMIVAFDGLPFEVKRVNEVSQKTIDFAKSLSTRAKAKNVFVAKDSYLDIWENKHSQMVTLQQRGKTDLADKIVKKTVHSAKHFCGKVKPNPENIRTEWRFGDFKSCERYAKGNCVTVGKTTKKYGKRVSDNYRFFEETGKAFYQEAYFDSYTGIMTIFNNPVELNKDTIGLFPELSALADLIK